MVLEYQRKKKSLFLAVFTGLKTATDLFELFSKHNTEKYLYPCSDIRKDDIPDFMGQNEFDFTEAPIAVEVLPSIPLVPLLQ